MGVGLEVKKNHVDRIKVKFIFFSFCVKYIIESKQRNEESFIISYFGNHTHTHTLIRYKEETL